MLAIQAPIEVSLGSSAQTCPYLFSTPSGCIFTSHIIKKEKVSCESCGYSQFLYNLARYELSTLGVSHTPVWLLPSQQQLAEELFIHVSRRTALTKTQDNFEDNMKST